MYDVFNGRINKRLIRDVFPEVEQQALDLLAEHNLRRVPHENTAEPTSSLKRLTYHWETTENDIQDKPLVDYNQRTELDDSPSHTEDLEGIPVDDEKQAQLSRITTEQLKNKTSDEARIVGEQIVGIYTSLRRESEWNKPLYPRQLADLLHGVVPKEFITFLQENQLLKASKDKQLNDQYSHIQGLTVLLAGLHQEILNEPTTVLRESINIAESFIRTFWNNWLLEQQAAKVQRRNS